MAKTSTPHTRSLWPRRAIVTAGMPYGNKNLHFGHVGGVFVPADFFARFLRDRIGAENVLFVSGTDCYGSPIMESYRKLCDEGYTKSIEEYVEENHDRQAATLAGYDVACDFFGGSALAPAAKVHEQVTDEILHRLKDAGVLTRRSTLQFYDPRAGQFLNGRQVVGRCPIQGCKSEKAYADECDLGHQFEPEELIAPVSALTGETPELRPVENLYFDLPAYRGYLTRYTDGLEDDDTVRPVVVKTMEEWLGDPVLYIQNKFREAFDAVEGELPAHTVVEPEGNKSSFTVVFPSWRERDEAHAVLSAGGVRFRSGKALVPFRITGNIDWGVAALNHATYDDDRAHATELLEQAIGYYDEYLADNAGAKSALVDRAICVFYTGDHASAIAALEDLTQNVDPGFAPAWANLGMFYENDGRTDDARQAYETAIEAAGDADAYGVRDYAQGRLDALNGTS